jgi:hypothetical protein
VLRGDEVPNWFGHKRNGSKSISFQLPSLPKDQIKGLFICAVCGQSADNFEENVVSVGGPIEINNRRLKPNTYPFFLIPITLKRERYYCIMYIPNPFTEDEIASGMEMTISLVGTLIEVKEFGIHLVVDEPNAIMDSEYSMDMASAN